MLALSNVGNKQPVENQWGLRDPNSVSRETEPFLSSPLLISVHVSLSHAHMLVTGSVEEEGDVEVTHCNTIAMAMQREPRAEGAKGEK